MEEEIVMFENALKDSQHIVFFGGAGVSTESGIPDFRSATGIFMQNTGINFSAEQIISNSFYQKYPKDFFEFYFSKLIFPDAKPNYAHQFLADLESKGKEISIVTQNIDGLHQKAGSTKVHELHGTVLKNYCDTCGEEFSIEEIKKDNDGIPRCPKDNGIVRPNIVLYEENLNQDVIMNSIKAISQADMLIVAGTSLIVYPAASFVNYFNGKYLVVINKTPIHIQRQGAIVFEDSISTIFKQINI